LGNYAKTINARNSLKQHVFQSRYVPVNISKLIILPNNVKTHAHLTKIDFLGFLEI